MVCRYLPPLLAVSLGLGLIDWLPATNGTGNKPVPSATQIVLLDAAATPVSHTFASVSTDGQKTKFANRAASIPLGFETLTLEMRPPTSATAPYRQIGKMILPTVAVVNGVDTVVDVQTVNFDVNYSSKSTGQTRKNVCKMISELFKDPDFVEMAEFVEPVWPA